MHGNAWEWVWDWFTPYTADAVVDPVGTFSDLGRENRGGGYGSPGRHVRAAIRGENAPEFSGPGLGFRLVRTAPPLP